MHKKFIFFLLLLLVSVILYISSRINYLLFHTIVEVYSIIIASGIFIVSWNSQKHSDNDNLVFLGIAYLFVAILDLFHMMSYKGLAIITDYPYHANQLWISARFLESISLFIFTFALCKKFKISFPLISSVYSFITIMLLLSIYIFKIFPICYIEDIGQTQFKILSEYIICFILSIGLYKLHKNRKKMEKKFYFQIFASILMTIISEFFFTLYIDVYGITNLIGHIFKVYSFYLIYQSVIVTTLHKPFDTIYQSLKESETKLKDLNATKDKFFSILAHDLKNQFSVIAGYSAILKDIVNEYKDSKASFILNSMHSTTIDTYKLLENLLNWARIQTGSINYNPETINLKMLVNENIQFLKNFAQKKNISIKTSIAKNIFVYSDQQMISIVLRNLLSNAIKFTNYGGKIKIESQDLNKVMQIAISDTGIGIPKEIMDQLFKIDADVKRTGTDSEKGTGLGLILSKEFIEKNKGSIKAESNPSHGSTFFITLPKSINELVK